MRTRSGRRTTPSVGRSQPEQRFSRVVLPHPEGPTTATNSPRRTSRSTSANAPTPAKAWPTRSRETRTSFMIAPSTLVAPAHAGDVHEARAQPVDARPDEADHQHRRDQQIGAQAVAGVPHGEA